MDIECPYDTYQPSPTEHFNPDFATPTIDEGFVRGFLSRQSTMQRYFQDPDRPYFHPASHHDSDDSTHAYPFVPHNGYAPPDVFTHDALHIAVGYSSPSGSTFDSAYNSSGMSERTSSPWRSPPIANVALSSDLLYNECGPHGLRNHTASPRHDSFVSRSCVTMHDVQPQADIQPDTVVLHNEGFDYSSFGAFVQEGYQPIGPADNASTPATYPDTIDIDVDVSHGIEQGEAGPVALRPRRISLTNPITTPSSSTRVARRPRSSRTSSSRNVGDLQVGTQRPLPLPDHFLAPWQSTAAHPASDRRTNGSDTLQPNTCYVELRSPPEHSRCLFCDDEFYGPGSWEQRMEHISAHLEAAKKERESAGNPVNWKSDEAVHDWLVAEGLVVVRGHSWVLVDSGRRKSVT
ncbi:hypothetical protein TI39_contig345g00063 [Zymoseptoria brevis]|uniref:Uncharacterized protein n=1 Tax=Zymoseptoria brevis TaxID=1047168 RepID=A0A0F4GRG1_9PEZI|nr:hypothetical protein TI39_contig345g00063 [Zymoseptoria brevis]